MKNLESNNQAFRTLTKWHNSNTRNMLAFVTVQRKQLAEAKSGPELYGALLSGLIWNVDDTTDYLLAMLNGSDNSRHGHAFVYLKLRILAFLKKHDQRCEMKRLVQVFGQYGIDRSEVEAALARLCDPTAVLGAFARKAPDERNKLLVSLLPAGELFITEVAYSCEFLGYQDLKLYEEGAFDPITRLISASRFVIDSVLPAFRNEHPYLDQRHLPTKEDQNRLARYRQDFGYDIDQWFVSRVKRSLTNYARTNQLIAPDGVSVQPMLTDAQHRAVQCLAEITSQIEEMEKSLNGLLLAKL
jgi:hypothetical protein